MYKTVLVVAALPFVFGAQPETGVKGVRQKDSAQTVSVYGIGIYQDGNLVVDNIAIPMEFTGSEPAKSKTIAFSGSYNGKKVICKSWARHSAIAKINPHLFFEGNGVYSNEAINFGGFKVELNYLPGDLRDELERAGKVSATGMLTRDGETVRYLLLRLDPAK